MNEFQDDPRSEGDSPKEENFRIIPNPLKFFLAGKAFFTLRSMRTQTRYTYRVVQATSKTDPKEKQQFWFVSFLTGPDNWQNYTYIGSIRPNNGGYLFCTTQASRLPSDAPPCKAISYVLDILSSKPDVPGVEIWHAGRCCVCGRMLTVPESIASGIGPECAKGL